jgi:hypothetical protein
MRAVNAYNGGLEDQNRAVGGSQVCIPLMRSWIRIRINVKIRIRIRITVEGGSRIRIKVMRVRIPAFQIAGRDKNLWCCSISVRNREVSCGYRCRSIR